MRGASGQSRAATRSVASWRHATVLQAGSPDGLASVEETLGFHHDEVEGGDGARGR